MPTICYPLLHHFIVSWEPKCSERSEPAGLLWKVFLLGCLSCVPASILEAAGESIVVGGVNYGQGSSREHAALVPLYLGVRAVIAKSFARIHVANLINSGILPLTFVHPEDYDRLSQGDMLSLEGIHAGMDAGAITLLDETTGERFELACAFTQRQKDMLKAGGLLAYTKEVSDK